MLIVVILAGLTSNVVSEQKNDVCPIKLSKCCPESAICSKLAIVDPGQCRYQSIQHAAKEAYIDDIPFDTEQVALAALNEKESAQVKRENERQQGGVMHILLKWVALLLRLN